MIETERDFSQWVVDAARRFGWLVARWPTWRSTGTEPGVPDLLLAKGGRIIIAELKAQDGKLSAAQLDWLSNLAGYPWDQNERLGGTGKAIVVVWRPSDREWIEGVLSDGRCIKAKAD